MSTRIPKTPSEAERFLWHTLFHLRKAYQVHPLPAEAIAAIAILEDAITYIIPEGWR